jgi:NADH:ubiquinone oxidoreductase subunit 6 (subunit J)
LDTLHSVLFYAFAAVTVGGGLAACLLAGRARALAVGAVAVGLAGLYADLNAGYAAIVTLVALGASALLLLGLRPAPRAVAGEEEAAGLAQQLGGLLAGVVLLVLLYVAFNGRHFAGANLTGQFNTAALGRLLAGRDALATEAIAAALLVAGVAGGLLARTRGR